jgi:hypothetical protein
MVTWNGSIPQPTDLISVSQGELLVNNTTINTVFNDASNGNFTKFYLQNVGTVAVTPADPTSALHALNGTGTTFNGHPIPFFLNSLGDFPLLPDLQVTGTNFGFKLGNIIVNYGSATSSSGNFVGVTFNIAFTSTSSYTVTGMPLNGGHFTEGQWTVAQTGNASCTFQRGSSASGGVTVNYVAIGT